MNIIKNVLLFSVIICCALSTSYSQPRTFDYTGAAQTYTVPACVYSVSVDAKGAAGGASSANVAGKGGRVQAVIYVTPGEVLRIYVGGVGQFGNGALGGWNGGGSTGTGTGASGGGASDVRQGGIELEKRTVVASGGGGTGSAYGVNANGGNGGGLSGMNGQEGGAFNSNCGKGGKQDSAGAAGGGGTAGDLGTGGNGGYHGGGGGGGYYGGGGEGGAIVCCTGGGGGGGSSYAISSATGVSHTSGFQTGSGQIIITPASPSGPNALGTITGDTVVCAKSARSYSLSAVPTATTYTWTVPTGSVITSGQGTTSITVKHGDSSGNISVTAGNTCGTSAARKLAVTVLAGPKAYFLAPDTVKTNESVHFTDSSTGATSWQWNFGDDSVSTDQHPIHSYSVAGTYTVILRISNGTCTDTTPKTIVVTEPQGIDDERASIHEGLHVAMYPQPVQDFLHVLVQSSSRGDVRIETVDVLGRIFHKVHNAALHETHEYTIDMRSAPAGFYVIRCTQGNVIVSKTFSVTR